MYHHLKQLFKGKIVLSIKLYLVAPIDSDHAYTSKLLFFTLQYFYFSYFHNGNTTTKENKNQIVDVALGNYTRLYYVSVTIFNKAPVV